MKPESIAFALAGVLFGLLAGWVIGSQQAGTIRQASAPQSASAPAATGSTQQAALLDEKRVAAYKAIAEKEPTNVKPRVELGNLYFDAERYDESIKWYTEAFKLNPKDPNVSTDLGVALYYTNQPDRALEQFAQSLQADSKHLKTLLNLGIVKAFGKQDLEGAEAAWQQIIQLAPDSPEGQSAKRALDSLKAAHPGGANTKPGV